MRVHGAAQAPYGFIAFCRSHADECRRRSVSYRRLQLTPTRLNALETVNRTVNTMVTPETDQVLYGVREHWTLPRQKGDCEDYVLLKRRMLIQRGWPSGALLITVVRDEVGEGHAVLTVRTAQGDFILDNKNDRIKYWFDTPYRFLMRQSYLNPTSWVALAPDLNHAQTTRLGTR
ncbi:MAG: transglutaminase-like cysteine peptidase [Pseudomonadota bacterium]